MKFGSFSTILNYNEYEQLNFEHKENKNVVLKLTCENIKHNGELELINFLNKESPHVCKIYKDSILKINLNLNLNSKIYLYLKNCIKKYDCDRICNINNYSYINSYFMENLGEFDVFDKIHDLVEYRQNIWDSNENLVLFMTQMCSSIEYLQKNSICHFDIKPENIMYNDKILDFGLRFKLIDFGFAECYPFNKNINKIIGTDIYVPRYYTSIDYPEWHSKIVCNDWITIDNKLTHYSIVNKLDCELMYKTDIFSLGMMFTHLIYYLKILNKVINYDIFDELILNMTHYNIEKRFGIDKCLQFIKNKI